MKKLFLLFAVLTINIYLFSQSLVIYKNDGLKDTIALTKVDSITFWSCGKPIMYMGKNYNTVRIGTQCWLKENLDVGTQINGSVYQTNNSTIEKWCFNDNPANCTTYGAYYQWDEAMQYVTTAGAKGICPKGWHIPTNAEYQTLGTTVNNDGNSLKAIGQGTGVGAGTNTSGFSALLAGYRGLNGYFGGLGSYADFWSSSDFYYTHADVMWLVYNGSSVGFSWDDKPVGFSIRCVKN